MRLLRNLFIICFLVACNFSLTCNSKTASSIAVQQKHVSNVEGKQNDDKPAEKHTTDFADFFVKLFGENFSGKAFKPKEVLLGGIPLGFTLYGDGVVVIGIGEVETIYGKRSPCNEPEIKPGDILLEIDSERIDSAKKIAEILARNKSTNELELIILRNKKRIAVKVTPETDISSGQKKLGLWIRDNAAGVGTLTFVCQENKRFGALGHPVCDIDTGTHMPVRSGNIFKCNIVGIQKAVKGKSGELRGLFLKTNDGVGEITKNNEFGVFGVVTEEFLSTLNKRVAVAARKEIKPGKASIFCSIDGLDPKEYDIEIVKANYQTSSKSKSMIIRIIDEELIAKTGGIVQGMSGSPIVQNEKLIGAVTHVFVSDPTKGFGVYADWMLEQ